MDLSISKKAELVVYKLNEAGFEAYIVGGCVRDLLMGNIPKDYDVTTSATPDEITGVFSDTYKCIPTGIEYGTVTVLVENEPFEITTFRSDGEYVDNRRPENVEFLKDIKGDLSRRDFTINAIAYNPKTGIIDLFGGETDIKKGIIRAVGNPEKRFKEDAIRILRAYRFMGRYDFEIEKDTHDAMLCNMNLINNIAKERILKEIKEIFESGVDIHKLDFITTLFPIIKTCHETFQQNRYHLQSVGEHTYRTFNNIECKFYMKLTMLLHDIGKTETKTTDKNGVDHFYNHAEVSYEMARFILDDMKIDNDTKKKVLILIRNHDRYMNADKEYIKHKMNEIGADLFKDLIKVRIADDLSKNQKLVENNLIIFRDTSLLCDEILRNKEPYRICDLAISGKELLEMGYEGKEIGEVLDLLLAAVIKDETLNEREKLMELIKAYSN